MSQYRKAQLLFTGGLLLLSGTQILTHFLNLPDFFAGALMGTGLGVEILALVRMKRAKNAEQQSDIS